MKKNLKSLKLSMPDSEKYFEVVNGVNGEREREREREREITKEREERER